jgi:hypothetical protein
MPLDPLMPLDPVDPLVPPIAPVSPDPMPRIWLHPAVIDANARMAISARGDEEKCLMMFSFKTVTRCLLDSEQPLDGSAGGTQSKGPSDKVSSPPLTGSVSSRSERATIPEAGTGGRGSLRGAPAYTFKTIKSAKYGARMTLEWNSARRRRTTTFRSETLHDCLLVKLPLMVDAWGDTLKLLRALFKLFGW